MKAILEFNLPEDQPDHLRAVHAGAAWFALFEIDRRLRDLIKNGRDKTSDYEDELREVRRELGEILALLDE